MCRAKSVRWDQARFEDEIDVKRRADNEDQTSHSSARRAREREQEFGSTGANMHDSVEERA